jgi:hypothetical protein
MDRRQLIREYKQTARPAGLFQVRNDRSGRVLVGASPDLPGMLNRQRFQLEMGSHPDKELQADWNEFGPEAFSIEVLDVLERDETDTSDPAEDLAALKLAWLESLQAEGKALYPMSLRGV